MFIEEYKSSSFTRKFPYIQHHNEITRNLRVRESSLKDLGVIFNDELRFF